MLRLPESWKDALPLTFELHEVVRNAAPTDAQLQQIVQHVRRFSDSPERSLLIDLLLREFVNDPAAEPANLGNDGDIVIAAGMHEPFIGIGLTQVSTEDSPAYCATCTTLLAALDDNGFAYQTWEPPIDWNPDEFTPLAKFINPSAKVCRRNECVVIRPGQAFEYLDDGRLVIKVLIPDNIALQWAFDRRLGTARHVHMSTPEATILVYLLRFLAHHGNRSSLEAVKQLLRSKFHYVRWEAVKTYCSLDGPEALSVLEHFVLDPHPELRKAATRTLASVTQ